MKEEQDKWCKALHDHMKDYAEPVPEGIWDSLERELVSSSYSRNRFPLRILAAAVVFIALLSSVTVYLLFSPTDEYIRINNTIISQELFHEEEVTPGDKPTIVEEEHILTKTISSHSFITTIEKKEKEMPVVSEESVEEEIEGYEINKEEKKSEEQVEKKKTISFDRYPEDTRTYRRQSTTLAYKSPRKNINKFGGSLLVGNIPAISSSTNIPGASVIYKSPSKFSPDNCDYQEGFLDMIDESSGNGTCLTTNEEVRQNVLQNAAQERTETSIKHKMPVTVGASFRYRFSEQFALESGLLYTWLSSEMNSGSSNNFYIDTYKYHYLGIPLKANWTFWNKKYYSFYASGGGMIEKCVSGKEISKNFLGGELITNTTNNANIKPLQFSLSAAVGVQLNLTEHLGLYVEPGVIHYFDDGSDIETIRKDKPTNFNLQVGLRFNY